MRISFLSRSAALFAAAATAVLLAACSDVQDKNETRTQPPTLTSPVRLALLDRSTLIVSDHGGSSVCFIDRSSLAPTSCFPVNGRPLGVAWMNNTVYIGNETTHAIERYSRSGTELGALPGTFTVPTALAVDEQNGLLFVLDASARTVSVLTAGGYPVGTITGDASGSGQMVNPVAMTVDPQRQEVLVSDYGNVSASFTVDPAWVRIYSYSGTFVTAIRGSVAGFSRPQGLFVDGSHIFLTDAWRSRVLIFTRLSSTMTATAGSLGAFGDGAGQLMLPLDTVVVSDDVYVTNNRPRRIERFPGGGIVP